MNHFRHRRVGPALLAALGVLVVAMIVQALPSLVGDSHLLLNVSRGVSPSDLVQSQGMFLANLWRFAPVAIVTFLSFWWIAPIHAELRFGQVLIRGFWTAIIGAGVGYLVLAVQYLVVYKLFGYGADSTAATLRELAAPFVFTGLGVLAVLGLSLMLVLVAGVVLWVWLGRHPFAAENAESDPRDLPDLV